MISPQMAGREAGAHFCGEGITAAHAKANKKADVVERPKAFHHVGLLVNEPPGTTESLFI